MQETYVQTANQANQIVVSPWNAQRQHIEGQRNHVRIDYPFGARDFGQLGRGRHNWIPLGLLSAQQIWDFRYV
ncbi:unnamed protein product [Calypogeia fissa]